MRFLLVLVVALLSLTHLMGGVAAQDATPEGSPADDCAATTETENEAIVRRWYEEALDGQDIDVLDELLADEIVIHAASFPDAHGPEAVKQLFEAVLTGFPDTNWTIEDVVTEADLVVVRWSVTGTHQGTFQGVEPTGQEMTWTGINIFRIGCGGIVEVWAEVDAVGRLQQLGVIPSPERSGDAVASPEVTLSASPAATCPATSEEENEAIARRWHEDILSGSNLGALDELLTDDVILHTPTFGSVHGQQGVEQVFGAFLTGFPDVQTGIEQVIVEDDVVVIRWANTGTHLGEIHGAEPTGRDVTWTGITNFRIECGRIAEVWFEVDSLWRQQQIGAIPSPVTPATATPAP